MQEVIRIMHKCRFAKPKFSAAHFRKYFGTEYPQPHCYNMNLHVIYCKLSLTETYLQGLQLPQPKKYERHPAVHF